MQGSVTVLSIITIIIKHKWIMMMLSVFCTLTSLTPTPTHHNRSLACTQTQITHILTEFLFTSSSYLQIQPYWKSDYLSVPGKTFCERWFGHCRQSEIHQMLMLTIKQTTRDKHHISDRDTKKSRWRLRSLWSTWIRFVTFLRKKKTASIPRYLSSTE